MTFTMSRVYPGLSTLYGVTWLWIAWWDSWWIVGFIPLKLLAASAGVFLILAGWNPRHRLFAHIAAFLAAWTGVLQLLDQTVWHHDPVWLRPGMIPGLALALTAVLLVLFGRGPALADRKLSERESERGTILQRHHKDTSVAPCG